ncbi:MAG: MFS transporter [Candidatus Symbiothrix sp.]|jgi:FHS family L-fucose permease-like MFS transporter|nr:MFS transporter [Candidatus Symbiothrix sp.]
MSKEKQSGNGLAIIMMIILFAIISFVTGLGGTFASVMKEQFQASNAMSQLGTFANFIAYAFMGIPSGILLNKIGYKQTALTAIVVGIIGLVVQYLSGTFGSFAVYVLGAFICGFSMCMLNAVVNPMLNTLGGEGKRGNQLIQIGGTFNSVSATFVPVFVGYLVGNAVSPTLKDVSPVLFIAMGLFALVGIVLALVKIPEPSIEKAVKSAVKDKHSALSFRHFVLGAIGIFVYVGVEVGIPNFILVSQTSVDHGGFNKIISDTAIAGSIAGTYWFLMLIGRLCGASLGSKISSKTMLTVASALGMILVVIAIFAPTGKLVSMPVFQSDISFAIVQVPLSWLFLVLCGLCTSIMWGGIFNLAVEGLGKYVKMASGFFMVMVCGGGILPWIQGLVADVSTYMTSYWVIFIALAYLLFYALIGSKNVNKDIPTE